MKIASAGRHTTVVVKNDNTLWLAGEVGLGDGKMGDREAGFRKAMSNVKYAAAGEDVVFVIKDDNSLWGWGFNEKGQVGNGSKTGDNNLAGGGKLVLTAAKIMDGVTQVASTRAATMAVGGDGSLWMWGSNFYGRLGFGEKSGDRALKQLLTDVMGGKSTSAAYQGASSWAVADLDKAQKYGLITDRMKDNMQGPITREEFAELATRLYEVYTGQKAVSAPAGTFTDTSNPEVLKAYQLGIVAGVGNNQFAPQVLINREQMAAMLNRAARVIKPGLDESIAGAPSFADEKAIESYFIPNVKFRPKTA